MDLWSVCHALNSRNRPKKTKNMKNYKRIHIAKVIFGAWITANFILYFGMEFYALFRG